MKKLSNYKAQGTIEYLIIVAIVIVIALVVVGILLSVNPGTGVAERNAKISWQSTEPWAITDWYSDTSELTVVLKNNTSGTLGLNSITIDGTTTTVGENVVAGQSRVVVLTKACTNFYSYDEVEIDFNTALIENRKQFGNTAIVGQCS